MISIDHYTTGVTTVIDLTGDDVFDLPNPRGPWTQAVQIIVRWNGGEPFFLISATSREGDGLHSDSTQYYTTVEVRGMSYNAAMKVEETLAWMRANAAEWLEKARRSVAV